MRLPLPSFARSGVLVALLLPLALAGCSGTRLGDALSRSFSGAPAAPSAGSQASGTGSPAPGAAAGPTAGLASGAATTTSAAGAARTAVDGLTSGTAAGRDQASGAGKTPPAAQASPAGQTRAPASGTPVAAATGPAASPVPRRPAPYRLTILLPQADASAPAEVVTQALRAAGVPFEVETIERIGPGSSPTVPGVAAASPQAAPTVRPAPAPR
ncbi:MAG: hypothetical protein WAM11_11060 [Cyanobium sp.]